MRYVQPVAVYGFDWKSGSERDEGGVMSVEGGHKQLDQDWVIEVKQGPNRIEGRVNTQFYVSPGSAPYLQVVTDGGSVVEVNVNHWEVTVVSKHEPIAEPNKVVRMDIEPGPKHVLAWGTYAGTWDVIGPHGEFEKDVASGGLRQFAKDNSYFVESASFVELS